MPQNNPVRPLLVRWKTPRIIEPRVTVSILTETNRSWQRKDMEEFSDINGLATHISRNGFRRIGVDGTDGVGKTTLAAALSELLGAPAINLDSHLVKNQGCFIEHLDYAGLKEEIDESDRFIVEGVCLLQVLQRIGTNVDAFVYVKRRHLGLWADERELSVEGDIETFIQGEIETARLVNKIEGLNEKVEGLGLSEEIIRYHAEFKPQEKANAIYWRQSS